MDATITGTGTTNRGTGTQSASTGNTVTLNTGTDLSITDAPQFNVTRQIESFKKILGTVESSSIKQSEVNTIFSEFETKLRKLPEASQKAILNNLEATLTAENNALNLSLNQRKDLALNLIATIAFPDRVEQDNRATCPVASYQSELAASNPARLSEIIRSLAIDGAWQGEKLSSGQRLEMQASNTHATIPDLQCKFGLHHERNILDKLFQNSSMEAAAKLDGANYNLATDEITKASQSYRGLWQDTYHQVFMSLTGKATNFVHHNDPQSRQAFLDSLKTSQLEFPVAIEISLNTSGMHANHIVLITGYEDGKFKLFNPHGIRQHSDLGAYTKTAESRFPAGNWQALGALNGVDASGHYELVSEQFLLNNLNTSMTRIDTSVAEASITERSQGGVFPSFNGVTFVQTPVSKLLENKAEEIRRTSVLGQKTLLEMIQEEQERAKALAEKLSANNTSVDTFTVGEKTDTAAPIADSKLFDPFKRTNTPKSE